MLAWGKPRYQAAKRTKQASETCNWCAWLYLSLSGWAETTRECAQELPRQGHEALCLKQPGFLWGGEEGRSHIARLAEGKPGPNVCCNLTGTFFDLQRLQAEEWVPFKRMQLFQARDPSEAQDGFYEHSCRSHQGLRSLRGVGTAGAFQLLALQAMGWDSGSRQVSEMGAQSPKGRPGRHNPHKPEPKGMCTKPPRNETCPALPMSLHNYNVGRSITLNFWIAGLYPASGCL